MWGEAGRSFSARVAITDNASNVLAATPWYSTATPPAPMDSVLVIGNDTVEFTLAAEGAHPQNGRPYLNIGVSDPPGRKVALMITAPQGTVHAWNDALLTPGIAGGGMVFQAAASGWTAGDDAYAISEPACTQSVICVGAHASEYEVPNGTWGGGAGASFSSKGPTLDGRLKPEISAPGVNVASSINSHTDLAYSPVATVDFNGAEYPFARASGTSMAAPVVTGVVAILLEAAPTATAQEIKEVIRATARTDGNTGAIPPEGSQTWGMGKLNAYRAMVELLGVVDVEEYDDPSLLIWPNPAGEIVNVLVTQPRASMNYELVDAAGRRVVQGKIGSSLWSIGIAELGAGLYTLRIVTDDRTMIRRIVKP